MQQLTLTDNEILNIVKPIAENMENGWNENNYFKFSRDQTSDMKIAIDLTEFEKQRNESYPELGNHKLIDLVALHKNPDNLIVIWKMEFAKRKEPGLCIYYFKERNKKIKGSNLDLTY